MTRRIATLRLDIAKQEKVPAGQNTALGALRAYGLPDFPQEAFWVVAYDAMLNIRTAVEVNRGSFAKVPIHLPSIYSAVLACGADRFVVAHNHPTGDPVPTKEDIETTRVIMAGANSLGLYLEDHYIMVPGGGHYSFVAHGLMVPAPYTGSLSA